MLGLKIFLLLILAPWKSVIAQPFQKVQAFQTACLPSHLWPCAGSLDYGFGENGYCLAGSEARPVLKLENSPSINLVFPWEHRDAPSFFIQITKDLRQLFQPPLQESLQVFEVGRNLSVVAGSGKLFYPQKGLPNMFLKFAFGAGLLNATWKTNSTELFKGLVEGLRQGRSVDALLGWGTNFSQIYGAGSFNVFGDRYSIIPTGTGYLKGFFFHPSFSFLKFYISYLKIMNSDKKLEWANKNQFSAVGFTITPVPILSFDIKISPAALHPSQIFSAIWSGEIVSYSWHLNLSRVSLCRRWLNVKFVNMLNALPVRFLQPLPNFRLLDVGL